MEPVQVYSNSIVENHSIARQGFISTLAKIARRDYNGCDYKLSDTAKSLDMDTYEANRAIKSDKTIDAVIGIARCSNGVLSDEHMLMVELRLDYTGTGANSRTSDMKKKEKHTRELLIGSRVDERCYFIFAKEVAPLRYNIHQRELRTDSSIKHWRIVTPEQFNNEFYENPPKYEPVTHVKDILYDVNKKIEEQLYDDVLGITRHWQHEEEKYYSQNNLVECQIIQQMICKILDMIRPYINEEQPEKTQFEFMLREEQYDNMDTILEHRKNIVDIIIK